MGHRLAMRMLAWALRHGLTADEAGPAVAKAFRHRDETWRAELIGGAVHRNELRKVRS